MAGRPGEYPYPPDEDGPEYLMTGWTAEQPVPTPSAQRAPTYAADAVTVWNTAAVRGSDIGAALPTVHLPETAPEHGAPTSTWQDGTRDRRRRRRRRGRAVRRTILAAALAVLVCAAGVRLLSHRDLSVSALTVTTDRTEVRCGEAAGLVATAVTNGAAGEIRYRWIRSDGTDSGVLTRTVTSGPREVRLPLVWSFRGRGAQRAHAVVVVLSPTPRMATVSFTYACDSP
ncbi:hypothetical protein ACWF95_07465 [Streptomyces vinaceus]